MRRKTPARNEAIELNDIYVYFGSEEIIFNSMGVLITLLLALIQHIQTAKVKEIALQFVETVQ